MQFETEIKHVFSPKMFKQMINVAIGRRYGYDYIIIAPPKRYTSIAQNTLQQSEIVCFLQGCNGGVCFCDDQDGCNTATRYTVYILSKEVNHRRRIKTEEKANVVAAAWGAKIDSIPCRTSYSVPGLYEEQDELNQYYV